MIPGQNFQVQGSYIHLEAEALKQQPGKDTPLEHARRDQSQASISFRLTAHDWQTIGTVVGALISNSVERALVALSQAYDKNSYAEEKMCELESALNSELERQTNFDWVFAMGSYGKQGGFVWIYDRRVNATNTDDCIRRQSWSQRIGACPSAAKIIAKRRSSSARPDLLPSACHAQRKLNAHAPLSFTPV